MSTTTKAQPKLIDLDPTTGMEVVTTNPGTSGGKYLSTVSVEQALESVPDETREPILWLWHVAKEQGWGLPELQKRTGLSATTWSRTFRGSYTPMSTPAKAAAALRESWKQGAQVENPDWVETPLSRKMFALCDKARSDRGVCLMWGNLGIGKTTNLKEYQRQNNHGKTFYLRFPAGASFYTFLSRLAETLGIASQNQNQTVVRTKVERILRFGQRLLIVDELHQAFLTSRGDTAIRICEYLRELQNDDSCGLVLVGTNVLREQFRRGRWADALAQLADRGTMQVQLPDKPSMKDVEALAKHYSMPAMTADRRTMVREFLASSSLRKLVLHLKDGARLAATREEDCDWSHFDRAMEIARRMENIND